MSSILVKHLDRSLLIAVNHAAALEDLTQRDWVIKVLARAVGWEAKDERSAIEPVQVVEEDLDPSCPECGMRMVKNHLMRRWECECGYRGKKER